MTYEEFSKIFATIGEVPQEVLEYLEGTIGQSRNQIDGEVIKYNVQEISNATEYLKEDGTPCRSREDASYIWVSTGLTSKNRNVYVAFRRQGNDFIAYFAGFRYKLERNLEKYLCKVNPEYEKYQFVKDLFDILLIKEPWNAGKDYHLLANFISIAERKIHNENEKGIEKNFRWNAGKDKIIFNSGLLDFYGNDILIMEDFDGAHFSNKQIVESKMDIETNGFSADKLLPLKLYTDKEELIFEAEISEFDIGNQRRLEHILKERIGRFPSSISNLSLDVLCQKLKSSLEFDLKMCERDYKWAVPIYSPKYDCIQYLLPYHINTSVSEVPELVLVVGKRHSYWECFTVLTPKDAYMDATAISEPSCVWLKKENIPELLGEK